jgi:hypothetical protein
MVLSDCGCSGNYQPLLDRVAQRIEKYASAKLQPEKEQEPVAWVQVAEDYYAHVVLLPNVDPINLDQQFLYTTPQREWQGLTDEEIEELASKCWFGGVSHGQEKFARAIEAKLKEKNA